jgi:pimeloyl-ACP methyl ester carboxylesterase
MSTMVPSTEMQSPRPSKWCLATFCVAPFGGFLPDRFFQILSEDRLDRGLVLILPGIEGRGFLNMAILHGLVDGDLQYAIEVFDWTTGNKFLTLYHLRAWRRNLRVAQQLAERIVKYENEYPGRPVWIVGHSGGGAMALLTAKALPENHRLTGLILLAAAISPRFDISQILGKVECGIWNFHSWLDCVFVGIGTTLFGTVDGWHMPSAGMLGFLPMPNANPLTLASESMDGSRLIQTPYHPRMIIDFNLGGHFGCVNRVFISENIAPLISGDQMEAKCLFNPELTGKVV